MFSRLTQACGARFRPRQGPVEVDWTDDTDTAEWGQETAGGLCHRLVQAAPGFGGARVRGAHLTTVVNRMILVSMLGISHDQWMMDGGLHPTYHDTS